MTTGRDNPGAGVVVEQARFCRIHLPLPQVAGNGRLELHALCPQLDDQTIGGHHAAILARDSTGACCADGDRTEASRPGRDALSTSVP